MNRVKLPITKFIRLDLAVFVIGHVCVNIMVCTTRSRHGWFVYIVGEQKGRGNCWSLCDVLLL